MTTTPAVSLVGVTKRFDQVVAVEGVSLDVAAAGFRRNLDAHGPNAVGIFSCSKSTNEMNFLAQKLARVAFGTNNIDSCNRT